jgi:DNA polymerase
MNAELAAVYHELLRRQKAGEKSVYLSDEALEILKAGAAEGLQTATRVEAEEARPAEPAAPKAPKATKPTVSKPKADQPQIPSAPEIVLPGGSKAEQMAFLKKQALADEWCCSQVKPGKKVVLGVGSLDARIFFCGEAPGAEEEVLGEPFVGPAGQLLTKIIQAMGLSREQVYIGNIMTYRPPMPGPVGNRAPTGDEMTYCLPYLLAQLEIVQPQVIVALGKTALDGLLGPDPKRRMGKIRGNWQSFQEIPLLPTYHPSFLLRNTSLQVKRQVWEDMLAVMERLEMPVTEKQRGYFL